MLPSESLIGALRLRHYFLFLFFLMLIALGFSCDLFFSCKGVLAPGLFLNGLKLIGVGPLPEQVLQSRELAKRHVLTRAPCPLAFFCPCLLLSGLALRVLGPTVGRLTHLPLHALAVPRLFVSRKVLMCLVQKRREALLVP